MAFYSQKDQVSPSVATIADTTIFCSGGGDALFAECRMNPDLPNTPDQDSEDDDDDDDDDDDGDDGANLMLSNASVQRRTWVSSNSHLQSASSSKYPLTTQATTTVMSFSSWKKSQATSQMLKLRGGSSILSNEFSRRLLVAALVTLLYETVLGHLLEFLKIVMQTSPPGTSYLDILGRITADKGIAGVWDGFVPWGVVQAVFKGGVFGLAHSMALSVLKPMSQQGKIPMQAALTLAGGIAGGIQGYVLSPTLLLKTRVMTNDVFREKMSLWKTSLLSFKIGNQVIQNEGVGALMKGSGVFAIKRVCDWASRYYFSDVFSKCMLAHAGTTGLTPSEQIAADLLGGTASTIVTLPLDVIVAKMQDAKKAGSKISAWGLFKDELQQGGIRGLSQSYLQGFEARLLHVCFTTVAMKTGTGFMYDFLFGHKQ